MTKYPSCVARFDRDATWRQSIEKDGYSREDVLKADVLAQAETMHMSMSWRERKMFAPKMLLVQESAKGGHVIHTRDHPEYLNAFSGSSTDTWHGVWDEGWTHS